MNAFTRIKPHYASSVAVRKAIRTAMGANINVGGIELLPNGTIRILDRDTAEAVASKDIGK